MPGVAPPTAAVAWSRVARVGRHRAELERAPLNRRNDVVARRYHGKMPSAASSDPLAGLVGSAELARRLGVSPATIRSWRARGATWLPEPVGRLEGFVWREEDLVDIEQTMAGGMGRQSDDSQPLDGAQKWARGAYYTPRDAAHFLATWTLRGATERLLEPSFGDGVFIRAIADVAAARGMARPDWIAGELDPEMGSIAVRDGLVRRDELQIGDFLEFDPRPVDAVIANPPFVRLRHLANSPRDRALRRAREALGAMSPSGSVWMPFVTHMVSHLKVGGRAAMVLPLDFTYVAYARPLWRYLADRFGSIRVLRTRERVFSDINQDVMILLADEYGSSTTSLSYEAYDRFDDMVRDRNAAGGEIDIAALAAGERAFQTALLPDGLPSLLAEAEKYTMPSGQLAAFRIGYIAGDKQYFHPSSAVIAKHALPETNLHRTLINSRRLRGRGLRTSEIELQDTDKLWMPAGELTAGEVGYVAFGERLGVHHGYKAQKRKPWYKVPGVAAPDIVLSVFSERPLLLINDEGLLASNSLLGGYLRVGDADAFASAWYTPLTLLSIGLEVHSLGGGVMVMVPNEASRVRLPAPDLARRDLSTAHAALLAGDMRAAYASGDGVLRDIIGDSGLDSVYAGIDRLSFWR